MLRRWPRGQALTEFALILPILLVTMFLIIETGRMFQAYVTVQSAAREGARYAITGQGGSLRASNIKEEAKAILAAGLPLMEESGCDDLCCDNNWEPEYYCIVVWSRGHYDDAGLPGERVQVQVKYNVRVITPILSAIAPYLSLTGRVEMINEPFGPTGMTHAGIVPPTLGIPPTFTPTHTPTPTSTPVPVTINEPLRPGEWVVTGHADPGHETLIEIWDWSTRQVIGAGNLQADGTFRITVSPALVADHTIRAIGTYSYDDAVVGAATSTPTDTPAATSPPTSTPIFTATPFTATPTGTSTPTPTETPLPYEIRVTCGDDLDYTDGGGNLWQADQPYSSGSWGYMGLVSQKNRSQGACGTVAGTSDDDLYNSYSFGEFMSYQFDDVTNGEYQVTLLFVEPSSTAEWMRVFDVSIEEITVLDNLDIWSLVGKCTAYSPEAFTVNVTDGQLNIDLGPTIGDGIISGIDVSFGAYLPTPTPTTGPTNTPTHTPTPTNTPVVRPDLTITDLSVPAGQPIAAWTPITITTEVSNVSTGPCNEFFWTDLYAYTDTERTPLPNEGGVAWYGLSSLGPNSSTTLTFTHTFTISGTEYLYTQADSFQFVDEVDEDNNVSQSLTVSVWYDGPTPVPTATPTRDQTTCGDISGTVWAFIGGQLVVPTDRVHMSLTHNGSPVGATETDLEGRYRFECVPEGTDYTVSGTLDIDGTPYRGIETGIEVVRLQETSNVDIILYPL